MQNSKHTIAAIAAKYSDLALTRRECLHDARFLGKLTFGFGTQSD
jgi:hypothetical protein